MDPYSCAKIKDKVSLCDGVRLYGDIDDRINRLITGLFLRIDMTAVVDYYRYRLNTFAAGEFFGKLMRAACLIYRYTKDERLGEVIDSAANDLMSLQDKDGDISTSPKEKQPNGSCGADLWERKYVLLGLWEYYLATDDEKALDCMLRLACYTAAQVGDPPKTPVTETGWAFYGIESSSILEPIVRLYAISGKQELLELAEHIVKSGACSRQNIFEATENGTAPADIGSNGVPEQSIAKAYEMMSCFEGLIEYYRVTGREKYLSCTLKFADAVTEQEITYLGSGGADGPYNKGPGTGEQWNKTRYTQAYKSIELSMETCVTVTYMKLMLQCYRITGDPKYIDKIEASTYNALCGAMNNDGGFFEYFPRFNGKRNKKVNFSYDISGFPLSCCTANGPMGFAILPYLTYGLRDGRCDVNLFISSDLDIKGVGAIRLRTRYPEDGRVVITSELEPGYRLAVRIPGFCKSFKCSHGYELDGGYAVIEDTDGQRLEITVEIDMPLSSYLCKTGPKDDDEENVIFTYGPIVLSRDEGFDGDIDAPISGDVTEYEIMRDPFRIKINGAVFVPYASAGRSGSENTRFRSFSEILK